jgi:hypothetical protein
LAAQSINHLGQAVHERARQSLQPRQQLVGTHLVFARFGLNGVELRKQRNGHGRSSRLADMAHLDLMPHTTLPEWNYTLLPTQKM